MLCVALVPGQPAMSRISSRRCASNAWPCTMLDAVQPYAIACGRQVASCRIARTPSMRSISMMRSGELPSGISMRAKCRLTPAGTAVGYHSSTTMLTLGTMTPSRTASGIKLPPELCAAATAAADLRTAAADPLIGGAVAMRVGSGLAAGRRHHVDIGIIADRAQGAAADFQHLGVGAGAVLQAMAVAVVRRKTGGVAGAQYLFAHVGDQHDLARQHIDEFVLAGVPMPLARPGAGRQTQQIDAELGQPGGVAELGTLAGAAGLIEGRRVQRADHRGERGNIDALWHGSTPVRGDADYPTSGGCAARLSTGTKSRSAGPV